MDYQQNLIDDTRAIEQIVNQIQRIAVLGIKTESQSEEPAFYVPKYLHEAGFEIVPVPVYYPEVVEILGRKVYRKLVDVPGEVDLVQVFRRPQDIDQHLEDLIAKRPKVVWFQLGIRNDIAARRLAQAGIKVVQDHCLMVEHRKSTAA